MKTAIETPPTYLCAAGREFYARIVTEFELDPAASQLLALASKLLDRIAEAREVLSREPIVFPGRFGPKEHPAVAIERNATITFARLVRELALDVEPPPDVRPPRRPGTC